jgi:hypothetical protein
MNDKKGLPEVIDAEYTIAGIEKDEVYFPSRFKVKERDKKLMKGIVVTIVRSAFYFILWSVRQVGSLMIDGISGTIDGVKGAAERESRYDSKYNDKLGKGRPSGVRRRSRPIWYIPTKEEEEAERRARY